MRPTTPEDTPPRVKLVLGTIYEMPVAELVMVLKTMEQLPGPQKHPSPHS
jgi:hypothetical protein